MAPVVVTRSSADKSSTSENTTEQHHATAEAILATGDQTSNMAGDIAKIYELLQKTSEQQESKLNDIKRVTDSMDAKLTDLTGRLDNIEGRLGFLEEAEQGRREDPPASVSELEKLRQKLDDLENRERRVNLRCFGFPEACEKDDPVSFVKTVLPQIVGLDFPDGLQVERCHRVGRPRPDGTLRYLIVRFTRFPDKERIKEAAWSLGRDKVTWGGHRVWFYDDYSLLEEAKQREFADCRKLLFSRLKIKSHVNYPATLKFKCKDGVKYFKDHKKALAYINTL